MKLSQTMVSDDEDFNLFLEEFLNLMNKYHYVLKNKMCFMRLESHLENIAIQADGKFSWFVVHDKLENKFYHTNYETTEV